MEKELRKVMMESTFSMATSSMTRKSQETFVMGRSSMKVDFLITCTMGKESWPMSLVYTEVISDRESSMDMESSIG